jgi:NAD-dependent SIR2 family protein deacetylase
MPANAPDQISADIPHWAHGVRSLAVLSGAGISTDSGIGDFRGAAGA